VAFYGNRNYDAEHPKSFAYEPKKYLNYITLALTEMETLSGTANINDVEDVLVIARSCPIIAVKRLKASMKRP
jgi:hypothetical protein